MKGFRKERTMFIAEVDEVEKRVLSGVFADTALLLGVDLRGEEDPGEPGLTSAEQSVEQFLRDLPEEDIGEPLDPALARLLPNAYDDDDEHAQEFRRLTEGDIRATKVDRLRKWVREFRGPGAKIYVPVDEAGEWVAALTDVRLVLATRLGIESEDDAEEVYGRTGPEGQASEDYTQFALGQIYSAATWLQESLLTVMMRAR